MNFEICKDGTIGLDMNEDHIKKLFTEFSEEIKGKVRLPANKKIFENSNDAIPLNEQQKEEFHMIVAKLLFYMKRV